MSDKKNDFGGANPLSLYIPMSDIELDLISRLVDSQEMYVVVHGWKAIHQPVVTFGDKNLHVAFKLEFDRPEAPVPVHFFDLELKTRSGITLHREKMSTVYGGEPLNVCDGISFDMVWDIAIKYIDPKLVKAILPKTIGLTTRLEDSSTHDITVVGNMKLDRDLTEKAYRIDRAEKFLKAYEQTKIETKS